MASRNTFVLLNSRCSFQHLYQYQHRIAAATNLVARQYPSCSSINSRLQRNMGSIAGAKNEYMVIVPDKEGALQKRIEVRGVHLANTKPMIDSGFLKFGGAMLEFHPKESQTPPMKGSVLLVVAESSEAVREQLSKDIYATSGVWDIEKMQITPFKSAIRLAL
ncbi:YciI-like protein [Histoplasma capsulatum var. duboisii H88]|uniref:YciI-like protein n=1 Tax=Ajellomyces capsulatus (strain H88) TaxID=544711 RepID=A0A8A1LF30_AJEC8|nr:YciI-like protein [Histoplasma capsulatum var. duboisii H88]